MTPRPRGTCTLDDCERPHYGHGLCQRHYLRWRRHGRTDTKERQHGVPAPDRFWSHVDRGDVDDCWPYSPVSSRDGYGRFNVESGRAATLAHRYAYELLVGPIPAGTVLDHQCHTPDGPCAGGSSCPHRGCVNPAHLTPMSHGDNVRRGQSLSARAVRNDLCQSGRHRFSEVGWRVMNGKSRWCAACADEYRKRRAS